MTFGGGMTMANGGRSEAGSAVKYPRSTHRSYSAPSTSAGAYWDGRPVLARGPSPAAGGGGVKVSDMP